MTLAARQGAVLSFDLAGRRVRVAGHAVHLSFRQFDVLAVLVREAGKTVPPGVFSEALGLDCGDKPAIVRQSVAMLRRSLPGVDIRSHYGHGYVLLSPVEVVQSVHGVVV